jgi:hypothetical protein
MTQEDKQLLLKDLCARLPYRVVVSFKNSDTKEAFNQILDYTLVHIVEYIPSIGGIEIKPYLRPMSSMTKEEKDELDHYDNCIQRTDFFYSHHIDCRFMIEKGLAIEVTEENNPYKE